MGMYVENRDITSMTYSKNENACMAYIGANIII